MERRTLLKGIGALVVGGTAVAACSSPEEEGQNNQNDRVTQKPEGKQTKATESNKATQTKKSTSKKSDKKVEILEHDLYTDDYGGFGVKGKAKNVSGGKIESVTIESYYYDAEGTRIAEGSAIANEVKAGTTFTFDSMGLDTIEPEKIEDYELSVSNLDY